MGAASYDDALEAARQTALPASIGAEVKLDAGELLKAGAPRRADDVSG
ncbi:hypothetical protein ACH46N_24370 [Streptomyces pristinaespiralis]|uniref:Uncharacterized protein n=1 Tax=Streptomyces pristinaespiralis TaxID=38300 RepID=A0A0M4D7D3_STRPR|nr:hypothetical protein [Streptomyces pristinaespiralis]ALC22504.1 hypothetical protein SPRI_4198 [Streptomyces pristinaespiralis]QMU14899.1 hypothetical protein H3L99_15905 [Streptomyces pristinaespiralis]